MRTKIVNALGKIFPDETVSNEDRTKVPSTPGRNPISPFLYGMIVILVSSGILLAFAINSVLIPSLLIIAGILMMNGMKEVKAKPPEIGLITVWDKFQTDGQGRPLYFTGRTLLAPYFPLFISFEKIEMTRTEWSFKPTVVTKDNTVVPFVVDFTIYPEPDKAIDFIRSGGMDGCKKLMDSVINGVLARVVREKPYDEVLDQKVTLHEEVLRQVRNDADSKSLGIRIVTCQIIPKVPKELEPMMNAKAKSKYEALAEETQREAELADFETTWKMAEKLNLKEKDWNKCLQDAISIRLQQQGKTIQVKGGKGAVVDTRKD